MKELKFRILPLLGGGEIKVIRCCKKLGWVAE
jgi:hypothetical protein